MSAVEFDIIIVGAGIAGASLAANLASTRRVLMLEREQQPGYHSTGRSAALFSETYGNAVVRALSRASSSFLFDPPAGFAAHPLATPRGSLYVARVDQTHALEKFLRSPDMVGAARLVTGRDAEELCPLLRNDYAAAAIYEPGSRDVDVDALHQGFLRMARANDVRLVTNAGVLSLEFTAGAWRVRTAVGEFRAPIVVNAAGAWADELAAMAGVAPVGIVPCRRTALLVDPPEGASIASLPLMIDIGESFYLKPDAGLLLLSPADETPSPPCDAQPDDLDVAVAIDRIAAATTLDIRRIRRKWAGLRSFAPDRSPVVGFDPEGDGFFWLAGQGGYGIQTAPAIAKLAAALVRDERLPDELGAFDSAGVSPGRFRPSRLSASAV